MAVEVALELDNGLLALVSQAHELLALDVAQSRQQQLVGDDHERRTRNPSVEIRSADVVLVNRPPSQRRQQDEDADLDVDGGLKQLLLELDGLAIRVPDVRPVEDNPHTTLL